MGAGRHLAMLSEEAHTTTFFVLNGATNPYETHRGGRPGNPFADMVHQFLLSRIMERIESRCRKEELLAEVDWDGRRSLDQVEATTMDRKEKLLELSVADDVVELVASPSALDLEDKVARVAAITFEYFTTYGAEPNLKPGKSNVMIFAIGKGADAVRREMLVKNKGRISFKVGKTTREVWCTTKYKHVGGMICANGDMLPEVMNHIGALGASMKAYDKAIINNPNLERADKLAGARSATLVHLEWNCHIWPPLNKSAAAKLEKARSMCLRKTLKLVSSAERHVSDEHVLAEGGLSQKETCTVARLRFLPRLVQHSPEAVWAILRASSGGPADWMSHVKEDIEWLIAQSPSDSFFSDRD
jgi:hypothetical protein